MSYRQFADATQRIRQRGLGRPWGVTLVSCFHFMKAGVLLLTGIMLRLKPDAMVYSQSVLYPILYVAMRGNASVIDAAMRGGGVLPGLIFLWGLYLAAVGSGLWQMKTWARRSVILTCGITLLLYTKSTFFPRILNSDTLGVSSSLPNLQNVQILLFFDAVVFVYLMRGHTAESFTTRTRRAETPW